VRLAIIVFVFSSGDEPSLESSSGARDIEVEYQQRPTTRALRLYIEPALKMHIAHPRGIDAFSGPRDGLCGRKSPVGTETDPLNKQ
jgi:hypothetical protein